MAISWYTISAVLMVIAHPDDETLFSGFIHALTRKLNISVDLICVTNGEGGFANSEPSEPFYGNIRLSEETIGRKHLPRIRQQELLNSGRVLGIRKYFFFDQIDLRYSRDVESVFIDQWDKEWVIDRFQRTIRNGNGANGYDLMLIMLPNVESHGHHSASGLLALEAINRLQQLSSPNITIPTVIGGSEFVVTEPKKYLDNRLADLPQNGVSSEFRFNLNWKISNSTTVDYKTVLLWVAAEHKSQGELIGSILSDSDHTFEQYFYFAINQKFGDNTRFRQVEDLFTQLKLIHSNHV